MVYYFMEAYMEKIFSFIKRMINKLTNYFLRLSVNAIRMVNFIINTVFILLIVVLFGAYMLDKRMANGYYFNYITQAFLSLEKPAEIFFTYGNQLSKHPVITISIFLIIVIGIFAIKHFFKEIWTTYSRRYSIVYNFLYAILSIVLNTFLVAFVITFQLNLIISIYVDGLYESYDLPFVETYQERREVLIDEIHNDISLISLSINKIIFDIDNETIDIADMTLEEQISFCENVNILIDKQNGPRTSNEHYLRNKLNYEPESLEKMLFEIENNLLFSWTLLPVESSLYHMNGEEGIYNLKFVSDNGMFEAVYDKNGILQNENNNPESMGTYNYADPYLETNKHVTYDVATYYLWGNVKGVSAMDPTKTSKVLEAYNKTPDAAAWRSEIREKINSIDRSNKVIQ